MTSSELVLTTAQMIVQKGYEGGILHEKYSNQIIG